MEVAKLGVGTLAMLVASTASAGPSTLGTPVGEVVGLSLGVLVGGALGQVLVQSGILLLIGAASLAVGIYIVRRKQAR